MIFSLSNLGAVALGGALGAVLRYLISVAGMALNPAMLFPWPTLLVNFLGSFLIGVFSGLLLSHSSLEDWRFFLVMGVLGALTTFSTFSFEVISLGQRGEILLAGVYMCISTIGCVALAGLGYWMALSLEGIR